MPSSIPPPEKPTDLPKADRTVRYIVAQTLFWTYKSLISPFLGNNCRFYPSCSEYCRDAICTHGLLRGLSLAMARLCRCHPGSPGGVDQVPPLRRP